MTNKLISEEELLSIVENRYNRCFLCKKRFYPDDKQLIRISRVTWKSGGAPPWNFTFDEKFLHSDTPPGRKTTGDAILLHEECYFSEIPEDWKF